MPEAHAAPKESQENPPPPRLTKEQAAERDIARQRDQAVGPHIAIEAVTPQTEKQAEILQRPAEAQARLISRLIQTQLMGEFLQIGREQVNWRSLVDKTESDPLTMAAVDLMAEHVAGPGIYLTADLDIAKDRVEEFFEEVNAPSLIMEGARDIHAYGLHILQKYTDPVSKQLKDLKIIPLESIYRVHRDDRGNWRTLHQQPEYYGEPVEVHRLVVFKWRPINQNAFGRGIAQTMYSSRRYQLSIRDNTTGQVIAGRNIVVPSQFDGRSMLYDIMLKVFQRYGMPYQAYVIGDKDNPVDQDVVENKVQPSIRRREEVVINKPVEIVSDTIDPRSRFEGFLNALHNIDIVTLQTPLIKLFAAPEGLTEASAKTALRAFDRSVVSRQRFMKRIWEREVISLVVKGNGFDPQRA